MPVNKQNPPALNLLEKGHGKPSLLFIHGMGGCIKDWQYQVSHFKEKHQCLAVDLKGHGSSYGKLDDDYSISTLAAEVGNVIEVSPNGSMVLIGHSLGCRVALELYNQQPERFSHLILVDDSTFGSGNLLLNKLKLFLLFQLVNYKNFMKKIYEDMCCDNTSPVIKARILRNSKTLPKGICKKLFFAMTNWYNKRFPIIIKDIDIPVLLIQSNLVNKSNKRESLQKGDTTPFIELMQRQVKNLSVEIVVDTGHFAALERPNEVNGMIEKFIRRQIT